MDRQFQERPIPNFYRLADQSVEIDRILEEGEQSSLEEGISMKVLETPGHSKGDLSFLFTDSILYTGDAIPAAEDFPIFVSLEKSLETPLFQKSVRKCR